MQYSTRRAFLTWTSLLPAAFFIPQVRFVDLKPKAPNTVWDTSQTFANFILTRSNNFAHSCASALSQRPVSRRMNPFIICGGTGLGKTHLMNAYLNEASSHSPRLRIQYLPAERFLNRFASYDFRQTFRENCDVLAVDGVCILGRDRAAQAEFLKILEYHLTKQNRVIMTSNYFPYEIKALLPELRSCFERGVISELLQPDRGDRLRILRAKAHSSRIALPDDVANFLADLPVKSVRHLQGNLYKMQMLAESTYQPLSMKLARL